MKRKLSHAAFVIILTLLGTLTDFGATRTTTASGGNWNATTTWSGGIVPASGDAAVIVSGASVTVTADATVKSIVFTNANANLTVLTVNSGITLTVSAGITNRNAATTNTSVLVQGPGTINCAALAIGGTTTPTPSGSYFTATLTSTISNLAVSGNLTVSALYNSTQSAANVGTLALGSGMVSVGGSVSFVTVPLFGPILTMATGSQNGTLKFLGSTPFLFSGGGSSVFDATGTNATVIYSGTAQTVNASTYQNLTLAGSGTKTTTGVTVNGILLMQGTAVASVTPTYGTNASLQYNGSAAQTNGPELAATLPNLTINNVNGVTLASNSIVSSVLTLSNGMLKTGSKQLTLATNASVSGGSLTSYVIGNLQKTFSPGTQAFTFPIGDSSSYAPVTLSGLAVTTSGSIKVTTTGGNHPQIATSGIDASESVNRYWTLTQSGGSFGTYNTTFYYPASDVDVGANASQFAVSQWSGGAWSAETVSGTPTTTSTSISGQSGFGDFVVGDPATAAGTLLWTSASSRDINWSTALNWTNPTAGGVGSPNTNNNVLFTNLASVGASALTTPGSGVVVPANINSYVDTDISTASLTNLATALSTSPNFHNIGIASGATLTVNSNLQIGGYNEYDFGSNNVDNLTISGSGAELQNLGSLLVVESSTNSGAHNAVLDLSGLDLFTLNGYQLKVGVEGGPKTTKYASGIVYLAKTNVMTAYSAGYITTGVDGISPYSGEPALYIGHNVSSFGSGSQVYLGITNGIYVDYATIGRGDTNALMAFNPAFLGMNPSVYLRGTNGGSTRVGVYVVGDGSAGTVANNAPSTNDFSGGTVDALIDYFCVGRGRQANASASSSGTNGCSGVFTFDHGTINANTLIAGYIYASGSNSPAIGTVNVNGPGTLIVNDDLTLAQAANVVGQTVFPEGDLNINGGTVMANTIASGGGVSTITMTNGTLVVTNTLGTPAQPINFFAVTNSTLQFSVVANSTNAVAATLTTGGATNKINIASLPVVTSYPTQFTLIDYSGTIGGAGFNFGLGTLSGYAGYISNRTANTTITLVLTGPAPTKLAITSVNGGSSPTAGTGFNVVVQSQDAGGVARPVIANTAVTLSLNTGSGALGGTLSGTITAGSSSVTISGVTYTKAESGVSLTATRTSGDNLSAANSSTFAVNGPVSAAQSTVTANPSAVVADGVSTSTITVTLMDTNGNPVSGKTVTLAKNGGSSVISAASGASDASGNVTFTVTDTVVESSTYSATDTTDGIGITQTAAVTFASHLATTFLWTNGVAGNWSTNKSWSPNGRPDLLDTVDFFDAGAAGTVSNINNTVDTNFTIQSLYYGNTNNFHTTRIVAGAKLTVTSNLVVGTETYVTASQTVNATMTGQGTFSLDLTANPAMFATIRQGVASGTLTAGTPQATLDMSGLDTFNMTGGGIVVGVESSAIRRAAGTLYLAKTNTILVTRSGYDANFASGGPGIYIGHNTQAGNVSPQGSAIYLGITNAIYADYIVVGRGNQTNNLMAFNPSFLSFNPSAYIRGTNYTDRVGLWTIGDNSAGSQTSPSSGTNDFTGGKVDALVNYMFVGRGRVEGANSNIGVGTLTFNAGTMDVNNLNVGYQTTNVFAVGVGTVNVNGGTLTVNTNLLLANVTSGSDPGAAAAVAGTLNIRGGTVNANNITDGGGTATITMTNGTLVVTNTLGTPAQPINLFAVTNSTVQFSVVANSTNAAVVALITGGTNIINIASLPNISSYPTQFTLVDYSGTIGGAGFNFGLGSLPGYIGYISNQTANSTITLVITARPFVQLQLLMPGETASPGSPGGKTGTPDAQTVGIPFNVTVNAVDADWNLINTNDTVAITSSDGSAALPGNAALAAGTRTFSVTLNTAGSTTTVTASDVTHAGITNNTSSSITVTKGNQTITFPSPGNQTYGVGPIALGATASSGLTVSYNVTSGPASVAGNSLTITGAGSVTIQASQSGDANWNSATPVSQTISVTQKTVAGSITANNKVYDGTTNATIAGRTLTGVTNSDVVSLTGGSAAFTNKNIGTNKIVIATSLGLTGANAGNYVLFSTSATNFANIATYPLAVSATGVDKVYDGTTNATVILSDNRVAGDMLTTSYTTAWFADKNAGNGKTVSVSGISVTGIDSDNYMFNATTNTTANITPVTLVAGADDKSRAFGTTNPVLTASYNGFISGEGVGVLSGSPALSTAANTNSPVGVYPIVIAQGTLSATNYTFNFTNGTLTIVEVPPILSIRLESGIYGQTNRSTIYCAGLTPSNTFYILASTNLISWTQICTQQAFPDGTLTFTDTNVIPNRFYRLSGN